MLFFHGSVPQGDRLSPERVADWIRTQLSCTDTGHEKVGEEARRRLLYHLVYCSEVPLQVAVAAMGIVLGKSEDLARIELDPEPTVGRPGPWATNTALKFSWLEARYEAAELADNLEQMNELIEAALRLLIARAGGPDERFEEARRQLRRHAPNISQVVRHLSRSELARLRYMPRPDMQRLNVAPRRHRQQARRRAR